MKSRSHGQGSRPVSTAAYASCTLISARGAAFKVKSEYACAGCMPLLLELLPEQARETYRRAAGKYAEIRREAGEARERGGAEEAAPGARQLPGVPGGGGGQGGEGQSRDCYVMVPSSPSLKIAGDITIAFFVKENAESPEWIRFAGKGGVDLRNY